jgi:hypothetical protein
MNTCRSLIHQLLTAEGRPTAQRRSDGVRSEMKSPSLYGTGATFLITNCREEQSIWQRMLSPK